MKNYFLFYLQWVIRFPLSFVASLFSMALLAASMFVPEFGEIGIFGGGGFALASYLAVAATDPELMHIWSKTTQRLGENKTEFGPMETGVDWGKDGPLKSQQVPAAPIKLIEDLNEQGKYVDVKIDKPLFTDIEDHLNQGRYTGQVRVGSEHKMSRGNFRCALDPWFIAVGDEDLEIGTHVTANLNMTQLMEQASTHITDQTYRKKDAGIFAAFFAGADYHHFIEAGIKGNLSNGAVPVGNADAGVRSGPREHRRSYVFANGKLVPVTYDADVDTHEANLVTALSLIENDDNPTLSMFELLCELVDDEAMIPCTLKHPDTGKDHDYFLVYVPTGVYNLLKQDARFEKIVNEAFSKSEWSHPLLNTGDLVFENFVVRKSSRLNKGNYFSAKTVFNAVTGTTANTTAAMQFIKSGVAGTPTETTSIGAGTRQFVAASAAAVSFGAVDNMDKIGRIMVLGSGALARVTGKDFGLIGLKETDYGRKDGIGRTHLYGQMRNEHWNISGVYEDTPQSIQLFVKRKDKD